MANNFKRKEFDFKLPKELEDCIDQLEWAITNSPLNVDLYQDQIRQVAHQYSDYEITDEEGDEVIHYYCGRRWISYEHNENKISKETEENIEYMKNEEDYEEEVCIDAP